jgi:hypothetical protein
MKLLFSVVVASWLQGSYIISEKEANWGADEHLFVLLGVCHLVFGLNFLVGSLITVTRVLGVVVVLLWHLLTIVDGMTHRVTTI